MLVVGGVVVAAVGGLCSKAMRLGVKRWTVPSWAEGWNGIVLALCLLD